MAIPSCRSLSRYAARAKSGLVVLDRRRRLSWHGLIKVSSGRLGHVRRGREIDNCLRAPGRRYRGKLGKRNDAHILVAKTCGDNAPAWGATMTGSHPIKKSGRVPLTFTRRAGTVPVKYAHKHIRMGLGAPQFGSTFVSDKAMTIVKTLLNNLWTHIGYEDDGRLVHTDKRTGKQKVSHQ
jgi:hypothetical protein